jgi:signal transduction histidine kinase
MLSPSPSDRQSSTDVPSGLRSIAQIAALAALTVGLTTILYFVAGAFVSTTVAPLFAGLIVIAVLGVAAIRAVRRDTLRLRASEQWGRKLRGELVSQAAFLDALVESLGAVSSLHASRVLERTAEQAQTLFDAEAVVLLTLDADGLRLRPAAARGVALGPMSELAVHMDAPESLVAEAARSHVLAAGPGDPESDPLSRHLRPTSIVAAPLVAMGELQSVLVLARTGDGAAFGPADVTRVAVFADFAARAAENAMLFERVEALLAQAQIRETERAELSRRLVYAEQDERRKLSLHLHDGPLQTLSGVAMMLDAVAEDLNHLPDSDPTIRVLETARARQRTVIRTLRELCFALEPWVLRDQGFVSAMEALADEFQHGHSLEIALDIDPADSLSPDDQVCLYQIVREAVTNAVKHARPSHIDVAVTGSPQTGFMVRIADNGSGFTDGPDDGLPHHGLSSMKERASILAGQLVIDSTPGAGTTVTITMPAVASDAA